jgi:hypothetical protein
VGGGGGGGGGATCHPPGLQRRHHFIAPRHTSTPTSTQEATPLGLAGTFLVFALLEVAPLVVILAENRHAAGLKGWLAAPIPAAAAEVRRCCARCFLRRSGGGSSGTVGAGSRLSVGASGMRPGAVGRTGGSMASAGGGSVRSGGGGPGGGVSMGAHDDPLSGSDLPLLSGTASSIASSAGGGVGGGVAVVALAGDTSERLLG